MRPSCIRASLGAFALVVVFSGASLRPTAAQNQPYELNVILSLSGPGTFVGTAQKASLDALADVVNKSGGIRGRPVKFTYYDDETKPQLSVQLANEVLAKHVPVVFGSVLAATCRAMMPLFANGPVMYCLSPAIYPPKGGYIFSVEVSTKDSIAAEIRYLHERGWKRFARLTTTDASGQDADVDVPEALARPEFKDMTVVANEHFNPTDQSVAAQVARIKAANPQAILVWAPGTPFGTALRGMKDAGLDVPTVSTAANMVYSQLKQYAAIIPSAGLYFNGYGFLTGMAENAAMKRNIEQYRAAIQAKGLDNDIQHGESWDGVSITISALRALGPNASAQQIRDWIWNLKGFAGITGIYDFKDGDAHGLTSKDAIVVRWDPQKERVVPVSKFGGYL
jgi:branched-chain amino acid transport system substrate-binding protein